MLSMGCAMLERWLASSQAALQLQKDHVQGPKLMTQQLYEMLLQLGNLEEDSSLSFQGMKTLWY